MSRAVPSLQGRGRGSNRFEPLRPDELELASEYPETLPVSNVDLESSSEVLPSPRHRERVTQFRDQDRRISARNDIDTQRLDPYRRNGSDDRDGDPQGDESVQECSHGRGLLLCVVLGIRDLRLNDGRGRFSGCRSDTDGCLRQDWFAVRTRLRGSGLLPESLVLGNFSSWSSVASYHQEHIHRR